MLIGLKAEALRQSASTLAEIGMDSLMAAETQHVLETMYNIKLANNKEVMNLTVQDLEQFSKSLYAFFKKK